MCWTRKEKYVEVMTLSGDTCISGIRDFHFDGVTTEIEAQEDLL